MLSEEHYVTGRTLRKYGRCLAGLQRFPEAETALLHARRTLIESVGSDHAETGKVAANLVELYEAWGKPDEAARWGAAVAAAN